MEKRNDRDDEGESSDELAETVDSITNAGKCKDEKRKHNKLTESEKREERRAANRRSALESRQRRKVLIEDLQKQVAVLTKETTELRAVNDTLRVQLNSSLSENHQLHLIISQHQVNGGSVLQGAMTGGQSTAMMLGGAARTGGLGNFSGPNGPTTGMFGGLGGRHSSLLAPGAFGHFANSDINGGQGSKRTPFGSHSHGQGGDVARQVGAGHLGGVPDLNGSSDNDAIVERVRLINELSKKYQQI